MDPLSFTISARGKNERMPLYQIDSVFGFLEASTLYSGRPFLKRQLSEADRVWLEENNIGLRIPFINHFVTSEE